MNVSIITRANVSESVLDSLAGGLPVIISHVLEVPGGKLAILKPGQVCLQFTSASVRDVGPDVRIMVFARSNDPRTSSEHDMAKAILDKVTELIAGTGTAHSVNVRLYLTEIGAAEQ